MIERQELYCHHCGKYVQFDLDMSLNGNHVLNCPNCDHEHCRVVENGKITSERWDSRNGNGSWGTYQATGTASTATSTYSTYSGTSGSTTDVFMYQAWMNTTTG